MPKVSSKAVVPVDQKQFKAEKLYWASLLVGKAMLEEGVISKEEYAKLDAALLEKYQPVLGALLAGRALA